MNPYTPPKTDYTTWTDEAKRQANLNAKAMNALYCALDQNEFNRISFCNTASDIWQSLEVIHEGTDRVKEAKVSSLVRKYELFRMEKNETITEMFTRFTDIINGLNSLGETYSQADKVKKVLRSLTSDWERKTTAIEEAQDLNKLTLDDLVGNLLAYEVHMQERKDQDQPMAKNIALKAYHDDSDSEDSEEDEDFGRKFRKFMKKEKHRHGKSSKKDVQEVTCYNCNKLGHLRPNCPLLKKRFKKEDKRRKAYKATICTSDSSSSEEEENTKGDSNMCFLAKVNQKVCNIPKAKFYLVSKSDSHDLSKLDFDCSTSYHDDSLCDSYNLRFKLIDLYYHYLHSHKVKSRMK